MRSVSFRLCQETCCCRQKWQEAGIAGLEWVKRFMQCHHHLSLNGHSFNQKNVTHFQNNYKELVKFKLTGKQIYNLDETGVTTAVQVPHIVAQTGVKQI